MHKLSKLLCVLLAMAVLCVALVFIVSAEDTPSSEVYYYASEGAEAQELTYAEAISKANSDGGIVRLRQDVALTDGEFRVTKSFTLDIGKHTLDLSGKTGHSFLFTTPNVHLNVIGTGTIITNGNSKSLYFTHPNSNNQSSFNMTGEADDRITVVSKGDGNAVDHRSGSSVHTNVDFVVNNYNSYFISVKGGTLTLDNCSVTVDCDSKGSGFLATSENGNLVIRNSDISVAGVTADGMSISGQSTALFENVTARLLGKGSVNSTTLFKVNENATASVVRCDVYKNTVGVLIKAYGNSKLNVSYSKLAVHNEDAEATDVCYLMEIGAESFSRTDTVAADGTTTVGDIVCDQRVTFK